MPFTLSHPVAILPLTKYRCSLSALVIGSLVPDFWYFIHMAPKGHFSHTLSGIFLFCLPAGLLTFIIFHLWIKEAILALLPNRLQKRLWPLVQPLKLKSWRSLVTIMLGLLAGSATHSIWDSFTHVNGFAVHHILFLQQDIGFIPGVKVYNLLQHISTIIGALILIFYVRKRLLALPKETMPSSIDSGNRLVTGSMLLGTSAFFGILSGYIQARESSGTTWIKIFLGSTVVSGMAALLVITMFYGILRRFCRQIKPPTV